MFGISSHKEPAAQPTYHHGHIPTGSSVGVNAHHHQHPQSGYYPPVPHHNSNYAPPAPEPNRGRGHLEAQLPTLAPNPWVKDLWKWLGENTIGVARVDLRRPMGPSPDQYGNNLLFARYKHGSIHGNAVQWNPFTGRRGTASTPIRDYAGPRPNGQPPLYGQPQPQPHHTGHHHHQEPQYAQTQPYGPRVPYGNATAPLQPYPQAPEPGVRIEEPIPATQRITVPSGARVKITRSFLVLGGEGTKDKPLVDFGAGLNIDMDRQKVEPVLRAKLGGLLSIKLLPHPCLKIGKTVPLGRTGMGMKIHYEVPLEQMHHFYKPPARLMVRLDPMAGSGVRLGPAGIEFDQQSLRFGKNITLRASAGVAFPRTLPIDPDNDDVGLKVQRLSLKALW